MTLEVLFVQLFVGKSLHLSQIFYDFIYDFFYKKKMCVVSPSRRIPIPLSISFRFMTKTSHCDSSSPPSLESLERRNWTFNEVSQVKSVKRGILSVEWECVDTIIKC